MEKKILVAVDGSVFSNHSLRYLGRLFAGMPEISLHLFYIVSCPSPAVGKEWLDPVDLMSSISPATRNKLVVAKKYMQEAGHILQKEGVLPEQIHSQVQLSRQSVYQDIVCEARQGIFDALVIGRRGLGVMEELVLGSVSSDVLDHCHDIPVLVIDGEVDSRRFLVPVDGTVHSLRAVDFLAHMLHDNPHAEVTLFNCQTVFGEKCEVVPQDFYQIWGKEWCDMHLTDPSDLFHGAEQLLLESGFKAEQIFKVSKGLDIEPSRAILNYALTKDFGTIVIGRRGGNIKKGIFKGVSDRVLFMAMETAVWIVG